MDSLNDEEGKTGRGKKKEGRKLSNLNELRLLIFLERMDIYTFCEICVIW